MRSAKAKKDLPQKLYQSEEEWDYLEEQILKHTRSACVCMTCQYFHYSIDRHCGTILICYAHQRLIPHGEHLTSNCQYWMQRQKKEIGWRPEGG